MLVCRVSCFVSFARFLTKRSNSLHFFFVLRRFLEVRRDLFDESEYDEDEEDDDSELELGSSESWGVLTGGGTGGASRGVFSWIYFSTISLIAEANCWVSFSNSFVVADKTDFLTAVISRLSSSTRSRFFSSLNRELNLNSLKVCLKSSSTRDSNKLILCSRRDSVKVSLRSMLDSNVSSCLSNNAFTSPISAASVDRSM